MRNAREPRVLRFRCVPAAGLALLFMGGARPALANDIQFLSSNPAPFGVVYTFEGRYLVTMTFSVVGDVSGTYRVAAVTHLPGYPDYCGGTGFPVQLVAGQPRTVTATNLLPNQSAGCPLTHTSAELHYWLNPPNFPVGDSVIKHEAVRYTFTADPPPREADPYLRIGQGEIGGKAIAFDGTNFLIAWTEGGVPKARRVTVDGLMLDPGGLTLGIGGLVSPAVPDVEFDGTNFLVVWVAGSAIHGVRVRPDGTVLDAPERTILADANALNRRLGIAFDGTNYLVAWRTPALTIHAARVSRTGVSRDGPAGFPIAIQDGDRYPWVSYGGGRYLVAWHASGTEGLEIVAARVTTGGQVLDPEGFTVFSGPGDQDSASVATDGVGFLVAWIDKGRGGNAWNDASAWAARVRADGTVVDDPPLKLSDYALSQQPVVATFDGTNYVAVWQTARGVAAFRATDSVGRRISPSGVVDEETISVATAHGHQFGPTAGHGAGRYFVAWNEGLSNRCDGCVFGRVLPNRLTPVSAAPSAPVPVSAPWMPVASPTSNHLYRLWAADTANVFATGNVDDPSGQLLRFDGTIWKLQATLFNSRKWGLWGTSATDVWTVGWCWDLNRYDGAGVTHSNCLSRSGMPLGDLGMAVWSADPRRIFTVGTTGVFVRTLDTGPLGEWIRWPTGVAGDLWDVWGRAFDDAYAVGELGTLLHWDGQFWTRAAVPTSHSLNGIWGSGPADVFAVGDAGTILHFDGLRWTHQVSGTDEHLTGVHGFHGNEVYAVGLNGTILYYDGRRWSREASGTARNLHDVEAVGDTVWAVGDYGTILAKPSPSLAVSEVTVSEPPSGETNAVFTVTLSRPTMRVVTVDYATADGTASASDYTPTSGTLTFPVGTTSRTVSVSVRAGASPECLETFFLDLSSPVNAWVARGRGRGVIADPLGKSVTATVSGDRAICRNQPATLQAALMGTPPWDLIWSDGFSQTVSTSPATRSVHPNASTTYAVTSVSNAECGAGIAYGSATVTLDAACADFYTVVPCRLADTRNALGLTGGPALTANSSRNFPAAGRCGIPPGAKAVAVNVTVVGAIDGGHLRFYPAGNPVPLASTINFARNQVRSNNAIVPLGGNGQMSVFCNMPPGSRGTTHVVVDVTGYFQ